MFLASRRYKNGGAAFLGTTQIGVIIKDAKHVGHVKHVMSARPSVRTPVCLSVRACVRLPVRPSARVCVRPSARPSVRLSIRMSVRPWVRLIDYKPYFGF